MDDSYDSDDAPSYLPSHPLEEYRVQWQSSNTCAALEKLMAEARQPPKKNSVSCNAPLMQSTTAINGPSIAVPPASGSGPSSRPNRPRPTRRTAYSASAPPSRAPGSSSDTASRSGSQPASTLPIPLPSPEEFLHLVRSVAQDVDERLRRACKAKEVTTPTARPKQKTPNRRGRAVSSKLSPPHPVGHSRAGERVARTDVRSMAVAAAGPSSQRLLDTPATPAATSSKAGRNRGPSDVPKSRSQSSPKPPRRAPDPGPPPHARGGLTRTPSQIVMPPPSTRTRQDASTGAVKRKAVNDAGDQVSTTRTAARPRLMPSTTERPAAPAPTPAHTAAKSAPVLGIRLPQAPAASRSLTPPLPFPESGVPTATKEAAARDQQPPLAPRPDPKLDPSVSHEEKAPVRGVSPGADTDCDLGDLSFELDLDLLDEVMRQYD